MCMSFTSSVSGIATRRLEVVKSIIVSTMTRGALPLIAISVIDVLT